MVGDHQRDHRRTRPSDSADRPGDPDHQCDAAGYPAPDALPEYRSIRGGRPCRSRAVDGVPVAGAVVAGRPARLNINDETKGSRMTLPSTNYDPGFNITRASHVVLTVRDLAA